MDAEDIKRLQILSFQITEKIQIFSLLFCCAVWDRQFSDDKISQIHYVKNVSFSFAAPSTIELLLPEIFKKITTSGEMI